MSRHVLAFLVLAACGSDSGSKTADAANATDPTTHCPHTVADTTGEPCS